MYSVEELLFSFFIAIIFIIIFKLHREIFKKSYWAIGDILSDIEGAPTQKFAFIRFLIVLILGLVLNFFFSPKVIIFGITLGAFLIVWPIFLNEENIKKELLDKKFVLRSLLALFVGLAYITAHLSILAFNLINEFFLIYQNYNFDRVLNLIADSWIYLIFAFLGNGITRLIRKNLNKKVTISQNDSSQSESEIESAYRESAATREPDKHD